MYTDHETGTFDLTKYLWKKGWIYLVVLAVGLLLFFGITTISKSITDNQFKSLEEDIIAHTADYLQSNAIQISEDETKFISFREMNYIFPKNLKCKSDGGILIYDTGILESSEFYYQCKKRASSPISKITNTNDEIEKYIKLNGDNPTYISKLSDYVEAGFVIGEVDENIIVSNNFKNKPGIYQVRYIATGQNGDYVQTRIVIVGETSEFAITSEPKIVLKGQETLTLNLNEAYTEPGYTATDLIDGTINGKVIVTGTVNTSIAGTYTVTYTVTNSGEKTTSTTRTAKVIGIDAPSITLLGNKRISMYVGEAYTEPGYTASDAVDGNITNSVVVSNGVNTSIAGTYTVTYTITNSKGIVTNETRTVIVENKLSNLALSLTQNTATYTNKPVIITASATGSDYSHTLIPSGSTSYSKTVPYEVKSNGTYIFKAYDKNGNVVTKNIIVSNIDTSAPTGSCIGKNKTVTVYATDNTGISGYVYKTGTQISTKVNTTTYTFTSTLSNASVTVYDTVGNYTTLTCTIEKEAQSIVAVTGVKLSPTSASIYVGGSTQVSASVLPSSATNQSITWASSNASVATVINGYVYGISPGTTTITATSNNGKTAVSTITVKKQQTPTTVAVTGITLSPTSTSIYIGGSYQLSASISPSSATNQSITWTSSNTSVATVSNGYVYGISSGTTTITATSNNGKTAVSTITVKKQETTITPTGTGTLEMFVMDNSNYSTSDAIIIRTDTKVIMVDAAGREGDQSRVINFLKSLGINKIDVLIGTHYHGDHIGNFDAILKNFKVDTLYFYSDLNTCNKDGYCGEKNRADILSVLNSQTTDKTSLKVMKKGDMITVGEVSLLCVGPTEIKKVSSYPASEQNKIANQNSLNIILTHGSVKIFLAGDGIQEEKLLASHSAEIANIDVLKFPHHGLFALNESIAKVMKPTYTVVSTNKDYFSKSAYANSKKYLTKYGSKIYQTYAKGHILVKSNGTSISKATGIKAADYKR